MFEFYLKLIIRMGLLCSNLRCTANVSLISYQWCTTWVWTHKVSCARGMIIATKHSFAFLSSFNFCCCCFVIYRRNFMWQLDRSVRRFWYGCWVFFWGGGEGYSPHGTKVMIVRIKQCYFYINGFLVCISFLENRIKDQISSMNFGTRS